MNYGPFDTLMFCGLAQNNRKLSGLNLFLVRLLNVASKSSQSLHISNVTVRLNTKNWCRTPQQKRATVCGKRVFLCFGGSLCQKTLWKICFIYTYAVFYSNIIYIVTDISFFFLHVMIFLSLATNLMSVLMLYLTKYINLIPLKGLMC